MRTPTFIHLVVILLLGGCNGSADREKILKSGDIENSVYTNTFFNLQLTIPDGWTVQDQTQTDGIVKQGNDLIRSKNEDLADEIRSAEETTIYLLTVFQHPLGTPGVFNASFIMLAEKLTPAATLADAKDYLISTGKVLKQTGQYVEVKDELKKTTLGGREFYYLDATLKAAGVMVKQRFSVTVLNGYALVLIISFQDDEQEKILETVSKSMEIN